MALLNQGFVRSLNLFEIEDAVKALQNLSDSASIPTDLQIFAGNTTNVTRLIFNSGDPEDTIENPVEPDAGTIFTQIDKIATFGNGDSIKLRVAQEIFNIQRNASEAVNDELIVTFLAPHGIANPNVDPNSPFATTTVFISLEGTIFENANRGNYVATGAATALNKKFYRAEYLSSTQVRLFDVGYKQKLELVDEFNPGLGFEDVNDPGDFVQSGDPSAPEDYLPYGTCRFFPFPTVINGNSGQPINFDQTYFIVFSDAIRNFRIGSNYSRTQLIDQIRFNTAEFVNKIIVIERSNETTQENLINLARPEFEDNNFTFSTGALSQNFNNNFSNLESFLDNANFFRLKKYLTTEDNLFDVDEIDNEGVFYSSDPDVYNNTASILQTDTSPGVYILNKDSSDITSNPPVINKLRAYSDNTQPWELQAGPPDVLEYQVLRDPITEVKRDPALQEMQIGNLTLGDSAAGYLELCSGGTEFFQGVRVFSGTEKELDLSSTGNGFQQVFAVDSQKFRFTHKIDCLIDGEFYSICLTKDGPDLVADEGTGPGSTP